MTNVASRPAAPDDPAGAQAVADELERIALGAVGLTTRVLARASSGSDLTFPQWRAILVLGEGDDGARIGEVASRVGVTVPATSRLLRRLERRGLTTLSVDARDRRAMRARLTPQGLEVRSAILTARRGVLKEVARRLSESERMDLVSGLRVIATELQRFA